MKLHRSINVWLILLTLLAFPAKGLIEPGEIHQFLETKHFTVIYPASKLDAALHYAKVAETSMDILRPYFSELPTSKIVVVLRDNVDTANGSATTTPRPTININLALPIPDSTIAWYDRWSYELFLHELVHILNITPSNGIYRLLGWFFGSWIAPINFMPRWWIEGLAVELETRLSNAGRLRSPYIESQLRALVAANALKEIDIAKVNEATGIGWPWGLRPYMLGGILWHEILKEQDTKIIDDLTQTHSRRLPFIINNPVVDVFGVGYQGLLDRAYQSVSKQVNRQFQKTATLPITETKRNFFVTRPETNVQFSPRISPDGLKLAFFHFPITEKKTIQILQRPNLETPFSFNTPLASIKVSLGGSRLEWHPDSQSLVYDSIEKRGYYGTGYDIYRYSLKTKKSKRLTRQRRARHPAINKKEQIVYVSALDGRTKLNLFDTKKKSHSILLTSLFDQRISNPLWWTENEILFEQLGPKTGSQLLLLNLATKTVNPVLNKDWDVRYPTLSTKGLTFSSAKSGVPNIYYLETLTSKPVALTNAKIGYFDSSLHLKSNTLFGTSVSHKGNEVLQLDLGNFEELPQVSPIYQFEEFDFDIDSYMKSVRTSKPQEYRAGPYMWPRYWYPFAFAYADGTIYQGTFEGFDPLGKHNYTITANFDTFSQRGSYFGSYSNFTLSTPFSLSVFESNVFIRSFNAVRSSTGESVLFTYPRKNKSSKWNYSWGLMGRETKISSSTVGRTGPTFMLSYDSSSMRGKMVAPEAGQRFSVQTQHFLADLSTFYYDQLDLKYEKYLKFFFKRHAIMLGTHSIFNSRKRIPAAIASTTISQPTNAVFSGVLARGYLSGQFLARNIVSARAEYRFPLSDLDFGFGTWPVFLKRLQARMVLDSFTLDGAALTDEFGTVSAKLYDTFYYGGGMEFYLTSTMAYHVPVTMYLGIYAPFSPGFDASTQLAIQFVF